MGTLSQNESVIDKIIEDFFVVRVTLFLFQQYLSVNM